MKKLILASGSPRRRELLAQIGLEFEVIVSDAEEIMTSTHPGEVVKELSSCKASAVALTLSDEQRDVVVIGSDTVVAQEHRILGKPKDEADAFQMIQMLQGNTHQVYTGVTLICGEKKTSFYEKSDVSVYPMTEEEIWEYPYGRADGQSRCLWNSGIFCKIHSGNPGRIHHNCRTSGG